MKSIYQALIIQTSTEEVYSAITTQDGLAGWWTPAVTAKPELNSVARFGFGPDYFKEMRITGLTPSSRLSWTCLAGAGEWIGTTISFELEHGDKNTLLQSHPELADQIQQLSADAGTVVILRHDGWKEQTPMFAECSYTWGRFLRSLKLFCETGKGTPWPKQHTV